MNEEWIKLREQVKDLDTQVIENELDALPDNLWQRAGADDSPEEMAAKEKRLYQAVLKDVLRERLYDKAGVAKVNEVLEKFDTEIIRTWRKGKKDESKSVYRAKESHGHFIAIDSMNRDDTVREVRVLDANGEWSGGSITLYEAELDWRFRGDVDEWTIKPAHSNASSGGGTPDIMRAEAEMRLIAADLLEAYQQRDFPVLSHKQKRYAAASKKREEEWEARAKLQDAKSKELDPFIKRTVRVTISGKKVPVAGLLVRANPSTFFVQTSYGSAPQFNLTNFTKIEVKDPATGRFVETGITPLTKK